MCSWTAPWWAALLWSAGILVPPLRAQSKAPLAQAALIGIVADTGKVPIPDAEVTAVRQGVITRTNAKGIFVIAGLKPGEEAFRVRRIGYRAELFDATLLPGDTLKIGVIMATQPVQLPDILVEAEGKLYFGKMVEFADRLLRSGMPRSAFVTQEDIDRIHPTRITDLLTRTGLSHGYVNGEETVSCPRGTSSFGAPVLAVYLNGAQVNGFGLNSIDPSQVQAIEVYKSAAERPAQFNATGSDCTVVIWTK